MAESPVLFFDFETIPDSESIRKIHGFPAEMSHREVCERAFALQKEKSGSDFLPLYLQRIVTASCLLRRGSRGFDLFSLSEPELCESEIVERFSLGIDRFVPVLVSWNGSGFDLPVFRYRCLRHGVVASTYWDHGQRDRSFKWNNYLNRFHRRHTDLMDELAGFQRRACAPLDDLCKMLGFPGKIGMDGGSVFEAHASGRMDLVTPYCETDVLNLFLVWVLTQKMKGEFDAERFYSEMLLVKDFLERNSSQPHWKSFLDAWDHARFLP